MATMKVVDATLTMHWASLTAPVTSATLLSKVSDDIRSIELLVDSIHTYRFKVHQPDSLVSWDEEVETSRANI